MEKNKKRKQKKQRQLLLLLLLLIGTGVFLGTATYAWFTANQTVTVNPIDVNVAAKSGLQISVDGQNWKSILTNEDITGASTTYSAAVNQIPEMIEPVSTIGQLDATGKMKMFLGTVTANATSGDWQLSAARSTETNSSGSSSTGSFVAYDLFLRTEQAGQIYLTRNSGIEFKTTETGIKNATRVGFVTLGNTTSDDTIPHIQALTGGAGLTNSTDTDAPVVTIWEPNYDTHTSYGIAAARDTYGITSVTTGEGAETTTTNLATGAGNPAIPYDGVKAEITNSQNITLGNANSTYNSGAYSDYFAPVTPSLQTVAGFSTNQEFITLKSGITKIRVYMWIEGQDVDCENNASGGQITFNLQFSTEAS